MDALSLETARLEEILNQGKAQRGGAHPANLSPYATVVQYLFERFRRSRNRDDAFKSGANTKTDRLKAFKVGNARTG